ncbi:hypothetical protein SAMN05443144_113135 [Fodinibius roseus]|uniref:Uncharacterized protein n=1 Tax=Fodinibius roseus TaxID=1194090 RepID=A0A1M5ERC1_9BACT|nr:hypothetical protein SAMN05443144_113135 [Fodinibius roseus]
MLVFLLALLIAVVASDIFNLISIHSIRTPSTIKLDNIIEH